MTEIVTASQTEATFRMSGNTVDPHEITAVLGIMPSKAFKAGDPRGKSAQWKHGQWSLSSEDHVSSTELQTHIEWLLDQLEPVQARIRSLLSKGDIEADIFCYWQFETFNAGLVLTAPLLKRLGDFNIDLDLDIYGPMPEA